MSIEVNQGYGYVYLTTNLIDNKKYIGKHKHNFRDKNYKGSGTLLKKAFKKYGEENFKCEILEECYSLEELNTKEQYWISYYNAMENPDFYNIAPGGEGDSCFNYLPEEKLIEVRVKMRRSQSNRSPETIEKMRYAKLGKKVSEETKKKISKAKKNKPLPLSGEHRRGIPKPSVSEKKKGIYFGTIYKNIYCLELDTLWSCLREVIIDHPEFKKSTLEALFQGRYTTAYKYHWCYGVKNKEEGKEKIKDFIENLPPKGSRNIKIQNLNTGEVFDSYSDAEIKYAGKKISGMGNAINKPKKFYKCYWVSLKKEQEPYNKQERESMINQLDNERNSTLKNSCRRVKCIETNKIYKSIAQAELEFMGTITGRLNHAIANNITFFDMHWEYIDNKKKYNGDPDKAKKLKGQKRTQETKDNISRARKNRSDSAKAITSKKCSINSKNNWNTKNREEWGNNIKEAKAKNKLIN